MKGYSTKYALAIGIQEVEIHHSHYKTTYVFTKEPHRLRLRLGTDFFETKEEAATKAKEMAKRRVSHLKDELKKMQTLTRIPKWEENDNDK